ncbi:class I SAM-dependent RNA methyltransferase [Lapillicoccus jejuensis]|uniref:23S rRNA m(5)U-1939 methyltransferase n=1 Tax=Lapillicoccus jejuensis TaxID=402171 RepID=A0A542E5G6_9MICO|nr:class I SAM-dependent RNA methyltransferase [Lapillicoccus jejuensis]TQJ10580.1 23S rRNA m(5)U-1939 methyltransferase [Lapillicoccus jejuensis]
MTPGPRRPRPSGRRTAPRDRRGAPRPAAPPDPLVGRTVEVEVGPIAHGGHCVARHEGRVVFVRHALPGELVRVLVTEGRAKDSFLRGDAVEVLRASPHRVTPPCPYAGPAATTPGCGGCDLQHVALPHQRELKAAVVREQLQRLAGLEVDVVVEALPGTPEHERGLRWRTRVELAVDAAGRAGLRAHRSHDVVPLDDCLIADERVVATGALSTVWTGCTGVDVVAADEPEAAVEVPLPVDGPVPSVVQHVAVDGPEGEWEESFLVSARGFWQVHPAAAPTFLAHVLSELDPQPGERALDLYAGVGLFAAALADAVGVTGAVLAVEGDAVAVEDATANLEDRPQVEVRGGDVARELSAMVDQGVVADVVVLDPPRTGAGRDVVDALVRLGARRVVYVACDPAALARDTSYLLERGWRLSHLRAVDAFPMTHHVECLATFEPAAG